MNDQEGGDGPDIHNPEAAERLRLSENRVRQLIADGTLPSAQVLRPKGKHLIHSEDVERLLEPSR